MKRNGIGKAGMAAAGVVAAAVLLVAGVYAYLTHSDTATNEFSGGNNEIEVVEEFTPPTQLEPGVNAYAKKVQIHNSGNVPCYIRVYVNFSDGDIKKVSGYSNDGTTYYSAVLDGDEIAVDVKDENGNVVVNKDKYINHLPAHWVYLPETGQNTDSVDDAMGGWFYYTLPVAADGTTSALFDKVLTYFASEADIDAYQIIVYAESVQIRDHDGESATAEDKDDTTGAWYVMWREFLDRAREIAPSKG
jgi:alternate signal-mediated exported protein